jgi:retinol-binding protein 3
MTNLRSVFFLFFFSCILLYDEEAMAQGVESKLTTAEMSVTIDSVNAILQKNYIFPEVADKMAQSLKMNLKKGNYNSLVNPSEFARQLTKDLYSVSNDRHLSVNYNPQLIAAEKNAVTDEEKTKQENQRIMDLKRSNFGFQEIKILAGNIGYLDLREFADPKYAGETAIAAMNFLSNADALIVDLRQNGGGSPSMIQLISSYFFSPEPVHLNNFYFRPTNENTQTWTLPYVPGVRRPDIDLYILTSSYTFSAAEEFCYNLKNLKRATIIGETTGGGAHPTGSVIATDKFFVRVPKGRAINPITNTNWEGTGVTPHIQVSAEKALATAHAKALENLR